jgi:hypothetical protein
MNPIVLTTGTVVQLSPSARNPMFAGCMMTVDEPKEWGALGFVQSLGANGKPGGRAYYKAEWKEMEFVGKAVWVPK